MPRLEELKVLFTTTAAETTTAATTTDILGRCWLCTALKYNMLHLLLYKLLANVRVTKECYLLSAVMREPNDSQRLLHQIQRLKQITFAGDILQVNHNSSSSE